MFRVVLVFLSLPLLILFTACEEENKIVSLSEVFDYVYAPGQHATLAIKSDAKILIGDPSLHTKWVYLGGFGGYIVAGFPVDIPNHAGEDFEVFGLKGAGPEPAVVYVMDDVNVNGKPDDVWYELAGNQLANSDRNYQLTYYKPKSDTLNITWKDNRGNSGELKPGFGAKYSAGWWWPESNADSICFTGTLLPAAYENQIINGADYWTVPQGKFLWGYAENLFGTDYDAENGVNKLDISQAIDANGNTVNLTKIRFIRIQSAVFQIAGSINEVSPEIRGARSIQYD